MTRAAYLRGLRERAGHTQQQAAELVHAAGGHRTWRRWEAGDYPPPESIVHLYCLLTAQQYEPPTDGG